MDLQEYYRNIKSKEADLEQRFGREVYVTSLKNSSKNTLPGAVSSATPYNAARVIVDETHRVSTKSEIKSHLQRLEQNRLEGQKSEARKKQEVVVVLDREGRRSGELPQGSEDLVEAAMRATTGGSEYAELATVAGDDD